MQGSDPRKADLNTRQPTAEGPIPSANAEEENQLENLTQTISNIVGILMGLVGAVGAGFFVYGAYQYLTAGGAPHQMERGKSAMMTAIAGIVLALVAYGIVELVMNAVVDPVIDPTLPEPTSPTPTPTG